jgi:SARP family transcriptional regulator, regulator of embCAB operon
MGSRTLRFKILGPLEVWDQDQRLPLGGTKERNLLALLLLRANRFVAVQYLIDQLWTECPPATARNLVQGYVSSLRKRLGLDHDRRSSRPALTTHPPGYMLQIDPMSVDASQFARLAEAGRRALYASRNEKALRLLDDALAHWRGPALPDVTAPEVQEIEVPRLEDEYLAAVEDRVEAQLNLGGHARLVGELRALVATHPTRERLRAQLMLGLYRCGRQTDALSEYQKARMLMVSDFGIEPGVRLRELELAILRSDPGLELRGGLKQAGERGSGRISWT